MTGLNSMCSIWNRVKREVMGENNLMVLKRNRPGFGWTLCEYSGISLWTSKYTNCLDVHQFETASAL